MRSELDGWDKAHSPIVSGRKLRMRDVSIGKRPPMSSRGSQFSAKWRGSVAGSCRRAGRYRATPDAQDNGARIAPNKRPRSYVQTDAVRQLRVSAGLRPRAFRA